MRTLGELDEAQREVAWARWLVLAPTVEGAVPLAEAAAHAGVPLRTAQRWLTRYRTGGLGGLECLCHRSMGAARPHLS